MTSGRWLLCVGFAAFALSAVAGLADFALAGPASAALRSPAGVKAHIVVSGLAGTLWAVGFLLAIGDALRARLEHLATHDALTGALNRGAFMEIARLELAQSQRSGKAAALIMVDLDHFKSINDQYGHPAGDGALRSFASAAQGALRRSDFMGRYGGEEFIILLPGSDERGAMEAAERMRLGLACAPMPGAMGARRVTLSAGVAVASTGGFGLDGLIDRADRALYEAKKSGRDRVVADAGPGRA